MFLSIKIVKETTKASIAYFWQIIKSRAAGFVRMRKGFVARDKDYPCGS